MHKHASAPVQVRHPVRDFMTPSPHSIGRDQPLSVAHQRMHDFGVRHLPVLDGGKLAGILSQRDALFIDALPDVDPTKLHVEEAMSIDVYVVPPDAAIEEVAGEMASHKYGCAVVADGARIVGIFTTVDALRALIHVAPKNLRVDAGNVPRALEGDCGRR